MTANQKPALQQFPTSSSSKLCDTEESGQRYINSSFQGTLGHLTNTMYMVAVQKKFVSNKTKQKMNINKINLKSRIIMCANLKKMCFKMRFKYRNPVDITDIRR